MNRFSVSFEAGHGGTVFAVVFSWALDTYPEGNQRAFD
jgi:hypothetical protein